MEVEVEVKNAQIDYAKAHLILGFVRKCDLKVMIREIRCRLQGLRERPACNVGAASKKIVLPSQFCHDAVSVLLCFMYLYGGAVRDVPCCSTFHLSSITLCSPRSLPYVQPSQPQQAYQISTTCTPFPNLPLPSNIIAAFTKTVLAPPNLPPQTLSQTTARTP